LHAAVDKAAQVPYTQHCDDECPDTKKRSEPKQRQAPPPGPRITPGSETAQYKKCIADCRASQDERDEEAYEVCHDD